MSSFHKQGFVSLWLTRVAFRGIPSAYLEGTDELKRHVKLMHQ